MNPEQLDILLENELMKKTDITLRQAHQVIPIVKEVLLKFTKSAYEAGVYKKNTLGKGVLSAVQEEMTYAQWKEQNGLE